MKTGTVLLVGRTNSGKSTLLNRIIGQKVAITTSKPQTTRFPIQAVYEDERGQIVFTDTPGIFGKSPNLLTKKIAKSTRRSLKTEADVVLYLVDHTRYRDREENKTLGIVRKLSHIPIILVFNKWDLKKPSYYPEYRFLEEEFDKTVKISALKGTHVEKLLELIFDCLPEKREPIIDRSNFKTPLLNIDSKIFIEDIIREKAYNALGQELPYTLTVRMNKKEEKEDGTFYIQADILTLADKYKAMIIGNKGQKIKEIGTAARKELEVPRQGKVYLDLEVKTDCRWMEKYI